MRSEIEKQAGRVLGTAVRGLRKGGGERAVPVRVPETGGRRGPADPRRLPAPAERQGSPGTAGAWKGAASAWASSGRLPARLSLPKAPWRLHGSAQPRLAARPPSSKSPPGGALCTPEALGSWGCPRRAEALPACPGQRSPGLPRPLPLVWGKRPFPHLPISSRFHHPFPTCSCVSFSWLRGLPGILRGSRKLPMLFKAAAEAAPSSFGARGAPEIYLGQGRLPDLRWGSRCSAPSSLLSSALSGFCSDELLFSLFYYLLSKCIWPPNLHPDDSGNLQHFKNPSYNKTH